MSLALRQLLPYGRSKPVDTVGLEIRPEAIIFARVTRDGTTGLTLREARRFPTDLPGEALPCSADHLRECARAMNLPARDTPIWGVFSSDSLRLYRLEIPATATAQLGEAVHWALRREETFDEDETLVDYVADEPEGSAVDKKLRVLGIMVLRREVQAFQKLLTEAGLAPAGLILPAFAQLNLHRVGLIAPTDRPTAYVHFGHQVTAIQLFDRGRIALFRTVPTGLRTLAKTLAERLDPMPGTSEAARLVLELPTPGQEARVGAAELGAVLLPSLERVARQIEWTGDYYRSQMEGGLIDRAYLGGTLAAAPTVGELLAGELNTPTARFDLTDSGPLQVPTEVECTGSELMQALGAALADPEQTPNLLETQQQRRHLRRARAVNLVTIGLIAAMTLVGGLVYAVQAGETAKLHREREVLSQNLQASPLITEANLTALLARTAAQNQRLADGIRRYHPLATLTQIHQLTPDYVRLNDVALRLALEPDEAHRARVEGVVEGEAAVLETLLTLYVQALERSPLLETLKVERTELLRGEDGPRLYFVLAMQLPETSEERSP